MSQLFPSTIITAFLIFLGAASLSAEPEQNQTHPVAVEPFKDFTGKILRSRVRLRLQPTLDSPIIKELGKGELLIVTGEDEDFYKVVPPSDIRAYIFRTFVLDNIVEGSHVNVRLEPDLDSPVIAKLNSGDRIEGQISQKNPKWLEIAVPSSTRFYISKDYVDNIGDASMMAKLEKKKFEVNQLLNTTQLSAQNELRKPFEQIDLSKVYANLNKLIKEYDDFPDQATRAKELLNFFQETYLQQKIAYLESKNKKTDELYAAVMSKDEKIHQLENQLKNIPLTDENMQIADHSSVYEIELSPQVEEWLAKENSMFSDWLTQNPNHTFNDFYNYQSEEGYTIRGIVQPYDRASLSNKPGDYVLINPEKNLPFAYLYSTRVNLQNFVGKEVSLRVSPRPDNHFAFPAYFVIFPEKNENS